MKKRARGKIINIGSMMSIFGASFAPAYAASKAASCSLRAPAPVAWAGRQHPGQCGAAGWIDTDLTRAHAEDRWTP
jgi:2-deoxy-D-gluconate 3-dehydrogenase